MEDFEGLWLEAITLLGTYESTKMRVLKELRLGWRGNHGQCERESDKLPDGA